MKRLATLLLVTSMLVGVRVASAGENVDYLYRLHCSGCHGVDGAGSKVGRIPPFPGIVGHFADSPEGRLYLVHVPGIAGAALPDAETAELLNYVLHSWGRQEAAERRRDFTAEEVRGLREIRMDDITALRQKLAVELAKRHISIGY
ncbi:cytochrome c [Bradyrhizobium sp. Ai1a-2]|uniref:c-type cytochrome n=1 Tax=Bradyrhizobium sp. Ai1a-2 TaxID=196490 RepID=UPI000687C09B|nr:cytochrome c [Bradyrhizobium sp. Ai1a-2]